MTRKEIIESGGTPAGFCSGAGRNWGYFNETCPAGKGCCEGYNVKNENVSATCGNCEHWHFAGFGEY